MDGFHDTILCRLGPKVRSRRIDVRRCLLLPEYTRVGPLQYIHWSVYPLSSTEDSVLPRGTMGSEFYRNDKVFGPLTSFCVDLEPDTHLHSSELLYFIKGFPTTVRPTDLYPHLVLSSLEIRTRFNQFKTLSLDSRRKRDTSNVGLFGKRYHK